MYFKETSSVKAKKVKIVYLLLSIIIFSSSVLMVSVNALTVKDGNYKIPVTLIKEYDNEVSMGNNALMQEAIVSVKNGVATAKVRFVPLRFMGFRGYLGKLTVIGENVKVLNRYDEYDSYNNPKTGTDKLMKGVKYPKDMTFPVKIGQKDVEVEVYVPVMGELTSGTQKAKLRFSWPDDMEKDKIDSDSIDKANSIQAETTTTTNTSVSSQNLETKTNKVNLVTEEKIKKNSLGYVISNQDIDLIPNLPKLDKGENLNLPDGIYKVDVELWNQREDKPSMGNASMVHEANIVAKNNRYQMYLGSKKMTVSTITASLLSLQILDGDRYYFANTYDYDLSVPGDTDKRPEVFEFDIKNKSPMIYVKVDPKVKPMGEVAIGARLKIDWSSLKKIDKKDALLINKKESGAKKPTFNPNEPINKMMDGMKVIASPNTFDQNVRLKFNQIFAGKEYLAVMSKIGTSSKAFMFDLIGENEYEMPVDNKKPFSIELKTPDGLSGNIKAMYMDDFSPIKVISSNGNVRLDLKRLGHICIYTKGSGAGISTPISSPLNTTVLTQGTSARKKIDVNSIMSKYSKKGSSTSSSKSSNVSTSSSSTTPSSSSTSQSVPQSLTSSAQAPNQGVSGEANSNATKVTDDTQVKETKPKESIKIIFFSVLIIIAIIVAGLYSYIKIGRKLLYELKMENKLSAKTKFMNENMRTKRMNIRNEYSSNYSSQKNKGIELKEKRNNIIKDNEAKKGGNNEK